MSAWLRGWDEVISPIFFFFVFVKAIVEARIIAVR